MNPDKQKELEQHIKAISEILYNEASAEQIQDLAAIEETIREQTLTYITPKLGFFLSKKKPELSREESEK